MRNIVKMEAKNRKKLVDYHVLIYSRVGLVNHVIVLITI